VNQKAIDLHNEYVHGELPRRDFLRKLAGIAGSAAAAKLAWQRSLNFFGNYLT
jgi:hypothetical protein